MYAAALQIITPAEFYAEAEVRFDRYMRAR